MDADEVVNVIEKIQLQEMEKIIPKLKVLTDKACKNIEKEIKDNYPDMKVDVRNEWVSDVGTLCFNFSVKANYIR